MLIQKLQLYNQMDLDELEQDLEDMVPGKAEVSEEKGRYEE